MSKTGRFGHARYARILAMAMNGPVSVDTVSQKQSIRTQTCREIMWRFERFGLIRVSEWFVPEYRSSFLCPLFVADGGESLPYPKPTKRKNLYQNSGRPRSEVTAFAMMVRLLREGATRSQIHEETGVAYMRVSNLVREFRSLGVLRISEWIPRPDGCGRPSEVLKLERGKDAPRPAVMSRKEIERRHRTKKAAMTRHRAMIGATAANGEWARAA